MGRKSISNSFVVNTIEESVIYTLVPSQSVVAKTAGGTPKNTTLSFRVMKSEGDTTTEVTGWLAENLRLAHIVNGSEQNDGSTSGSSVTVDIASLYGSNSNVQWLLYHGTDIVHRMYIGSSNDGGNGVSPTVYSIDVTPPSVSIPSIADSTTFVATASFYKTIGDSRSAASVYWAVYVRNNAGSMRLVAGGTTTAATSANLSFSVSRSDAAIEVYINTTATVGSWVAKSVIDIAKEGKRGRFYYYAGDWPAIIPLGDTTTFEVTDQRAPFFRRTEWEIDDDGKVKEITTYWQFIGANGNYTYSQMGKPTIANANFVKMVNDFSYLITEAVFANFAKFGSAIISGDWMLSAIGTRGGVESTHYEYFDGNYPDLSNADGTNFIPKYCVNMRTGQIYGVEFRTAPTADGLYAVFNSQGMGFYAANGNPFILFGVDSAQNPIMKFYNKEGVFLYDLGPEGLKKADSQDYMLVIQLLANAPYYDDYYPLTNESTRVGNAMVQIAKAIKEAYTQVKLITGYPQYHVYMAKTMGIYTEIAKGQSVPFATKNLDTDEEKTQNLNFETAITAAQAESIDGKWLMQKPNQGLTMTGTNTTQYVWVTEHEYSYYGEAPSDYEGLRGTLSKVYGGYFGYEVDFTANVRYRIIKVYYYGDLVAETKVYYNVTT